METSLYFVVHRKTPILAFVATCHSSDGTTEVWINFDSMLLQVRLLSIGKDLPLLRTRCAVLASCGYEAELATVTEVGLRFARKRPDAIIVSAMLSDAELSQIAMATKGTPALVLQGFVSTKDLLAQVENLLKKTRRQN